MDAKTGSMGCPVDRPTTVRSLLGRTNRDWWPESLPLDILQQGGGSPDPMGDDFDYAEAFHALDYQALKRYPHALLTDSHPWWPPACGHTGPRAPGSRTPPAVQPPPPGPPPSRPRHRYRPAAARC